MRAIKIGYRLLLGGWVLWSIVACSGSAERTPSPPVGGSPSAPSPVPTVAVAITANPAPPPAPAPIVHLTEVEPGQTVGLVVPRAGADHGLFAEEGIELEFSQVARGDTRTAALVSGDAQIVV